MGKVSLILPVYNEQVILRDVLTKYINDLENIRRQCQMDWEVVAVDDCSADESKLILMDFARRHRNFKVVSLAKRAGKHAAVTAGFAVATGSVVMVTEIDLQNPNGLLLNMVQEHLQSGVPILYGYREFTGRKRRHAFFSDRLTRFACRLFLIDGYFNGIVNAELYAADVVDVLRSNPDKNKYMRTMNNWIGWPVKEMWYSSEYTDMEAKIKLEQLRRRNRHYRAYHKTGHEASGSKWYGVLFLFLAALSFVVSFSLVGKINFVFMTALFVLSFGLLAVALLFFLRSVLLARLGKINYRPGEIIYEIKSILNK